MPMKVVVYSDVNAKRGEEAEPPLSPTESMIRCLDLLDFNAALTKAGKFTYRKQSDGIKWIELNFLKK